MNHDLYSDSDSIARMRIMNAAIAHLLKSGSETVTIQTLRTALHVESAFLQKYYPTVDSLIDDIIGQIVKDIEVILEALVSSDIAPLVEDGRLLLLSDRIVFADKETATTLGDKIIDYWSALLDHLIIRRNTLRLVAVESLSEGKRKGCIDRICQLFLPSGSNTIFSTPVFDHWALDEEASFSWLDSNVRPLFSYALAYESLNLENLVQKDNHFRSGILSRIRRTNQMLFDGVNYRFTFGE